MQIIFYASEYKTSCFIKNVVTAPNVIIGAYTYYDDGSAPLEFEKNNILFNYPELGDRLMIGKFCAIASGTKFIMNAANHRLHSVTTYPFHVLGGLWREKTPNHLSELPFKGDIVVGNDVWIGRESLIMPGVKIGDGAIIGTRAIVTKDVPPYTIVGGVPAKTIRKRFSDDTIAALLQISWWDWPEEKIKQHISDIQAGRIDRLQPLCKGEPHDGL